MAKATFRLPSKMTQYGYAEVTFDVPDNTNMEDFGREYAQAVKTFQAGERAKPAEAAPAPAPAPAVVTPPVSVEQSAAQLIESELGGKVIAEETAPWDEDAPPKAEPWKNNSTIEDLFA